MKLVDISGIRRGNILRDETCEIAIRSQYKNTGELYEEHLAFFVCCLKM
jgi:hypothetical protein